MNLDGRCVALRYVPVAEHARNKKFHAYIIGVHLNFCRR